MAKKTNTRTINIVVSEDLTSKKTTINYTGKSETTSIKGEITLKGFQDSEAIAKAVAGKLPSEF